MKRTDVGFIILKRITLYACWMTPRPTLYLFCRGKNIGRGRSPRQNKYNVGHGVVQTSVLLYPNIRLPHHLHTTPGKTTNPQEIYYFIENMCIECTKRT